MRRLARDVAGFITCLFDSHKLWYDARCDWHECRRRWCRERRHPDYLKWWYETHA